MGWVTCIGKKKKGKCSKGNDFSICSSNTSLNPDRVSKAFHVPYFPPAP